ncbi:ParA family protein [Clostridium mediterraneense]|uniref:ParA family protein n=1 Tax=Clostridium mediterraneense TaxID=1805472 RepID=UPI000A05831D|nr:ParA family protein [Clostridium mediterraneense]
MEGLIYVKLITVGTLKGGVGKTTVVFNLAGCLAAKKQKILLIDADPQGNISENLGMAQDDDFDFEYTYNTLSEILTKDIRPSEVIIKNLLEETNYIDLIPSNIDLTVTESELQLMGIRGINPQKRLLNWIDANREFLEASYDYIICDVGPNIGLITQNCLYASDEIYMVSDIGMNSFKGCKLFMSEWDSACSDIGIENKIKGLIVNKFDRRTVLSKQFAIYLSKQDIFDGLIFDTLIPDTVKFKHSEVSGLPVAFNDPKSTACEAYEELIKEMRQKGLL